MTRNLPGLFNEAHMTHDNYAAVREGLAQKLWENPEIRERLARADWNDAGFRSAYSAVAKLGANDLYEQAAEYALAAKDREFAMQLVEEFTLRAEARDAMHKAYAARYIYSNDYLHAWLARDTVRRLRAMLEVAA